MGKDGTSHMQCLLSSIYYCKFLKGHFTQNWYFTYKWSIYVSTRLFFILYSTIPYRQEIFPPLPPALLLHHSCCYNRIILSSSFGLLIIYLNYNSDLWAVIAELSSCWSCRSPDFSMQMRGSDFKCSKFISDLWKDWCQEVRRTARHFQKEGSAIATNILSL